VNDRAQRLLWLRPGDIVFGLTPSGLEKLLLVEGVSDEEIAARHVTTQVRVRFNRATGQSTWAEEEGSCEIVSIAPLAPHAYGVVMGLDRKMRLAAPPNGFRLSDDEIQALLTLSDYFKANPLDA
jgi:hypothetical protein